MTHTEITVRICFEIIRYVIHITIHKGLCIYLEKFESFYDIKATHAYFILSFINYEST